MQGQEEPGQPVRWQVMQILADTLSADLSLYIEYASSAEAAAARNALHASRGIHGNYDELNLISDASLVHQDDVPVTAEWVLTNTNQQ